MASINLYGAWKDSKFIASAIDFRMTEPKFISVRIALVGARSQDDVSLFCSTPEQAIALLESALDQVRALPSTDQLVGSERESHPVSI